MSTQSAVYVDSHLYMISPDDAWKLWHQLNELAQAIWEAYEQPFLEFCIQKAKNQSYSESLPFD